MCKAPAPGRTKTRLCPPLSPEDAAELYAALVADTLDNIMALPNVTPVAAVTPPGDAAYFRARNIAGLQVWPIDGVDIGACLAAVIRRALQAGYRYVIAINSDGPTLPVARFDEARALLAAGADVVFGPNHDGGYYLIGVKKEQPRLLMNGDAEFADIAWSTPQVHAQSWERAHALGLEVAELPPHGDVDEYDDLARLAREVHALPPERCRRTRAWLAAQSLLV